MSSLQAATDFLSAVTGTTVDPPLVFAPEPSQVPPCGPVEPDFGCVDWYLYPQQVLDAAS